jgi:pSer/pThr/pTyr-binding forkhead associated (FHA) protein
MPFDPPLFIIHGGRRHTVTRTTFVIGRASAGVHLALDAANVAHRHAVVILTRGIYYLKDFDGAVFHKGMRIDTKRIEESDVFQIGDTEIRFTYQPG